MVGVAFEIHVFERRTRYWKALTAADPQHEYCGPPWGREPQVKNRRGNRLIIIYYTLLIERLHYYGL